MNPTKCFLLLISFVFVLNISAQTTGNDSTVQQKLPAQAFAVMPVFVGLGVENAFPHEKKYQNLDHDKLNLSMKNSQVYSLYGSIPDCEKNQRLCG